MSRKGKERKRERESECTRREAKGGTETRRVLQERRNERTTEKQRGPTSPVHALNMYVYAYTRACARTRANINVYHEVHLYPVCIRKAHIHIQMHTYI